MLEAIDQQVTWEVGGVWPTPRVHNKQAIEHSVRNQSTASCKFSKYSWKLIFQQSAHKGMYADKRTAKFLHWSITNQHDFPFVQSEISFAYT